MGKKKEEGGRGTEILREAERCARNVYSVPKSLVGPTGSTKTTALTLGDIQNPLITFFHLARGALITEKTQSQQRKRRTNVYREEITKKDTAR